jgi:PAS domain S-box-containing protein
MISQPQEHVEVDAASLVGCEFVEADYGLANLFVDTRDLTGPELRQRPGRRRRDLADGAAERRAQPREELLGQQLDMLVHDRVRATHPTQRASYFANPTTRPMGAELKLTARRKDGTEFPVDISLSSLETEEGVLVSAAVRDITDRRNIEDERAKLEARLRRAEHEEERAVLEAQLHQSQRLESLGHLAGGVAHDFNNLLAGILNYTALVADVLDEQSRRLGVAGEDAFVTLAQDVAEIGKIATRAAGLTRQLLIFSRREIITPEVLDINSIVVEMEKLLRRTMGRTSTSKLLSTRICRASMPTGAR